VSPGTVETVDALENPVDEQFRVGNEEATTKKQIIYVMTRYLAGQCDGAVLRDDVGFNGAHARFGKAMAQLPLEQWTPRQVWAMRRILETYKNTQLAHLWVIIPEIEEPPDIPKRFVSGGYVAPPRPVPRQWRTLKFTDDAGTYLRDMRGVGAMVFDQNYDPALIAAIKSIPGRRYDGTHKVWIVPITASEGIEAVLDVACEFGYDVPDETHTALETQVFTAITRIEQSHAKDTTFEIPDLPDGLALYPFQRAGVEFMARTHNVLNGDDMGLGKTPQALVTAKITDAFPMVVICPATLKDNWAREARKWCPERTVQIAESKSLLVTETMVPLADITVINYDLLKRHAGVMATGRWGAIVVDECHKVKNPKSLRHKMVEMIINTNTSARVMMLSGTPVVNEPMEFWSLIKLLGYGPRFGGERSYKYRYDTYYKQRLEELNQKARELFMVRRSKIQVLSDLPDKTRTVVPIEIANRDHYDEVESDLAAYMAKIAVAKTTFDPSESLKEIVRLGLTMEESGQFLLNAMKRWDQDVYSGKYDVVSRHEQLLRWGQLKKLAVEGKMPAVFDWLDEFIDDTDQKIVVFVWHIETGQRIAKRYNADFIYGGMANTDRQPAVDRFTDDPKRRILVGNIQAAGEGLNIQAASNVAFVEYGWNPKDHEQAEDRCHRIGQKNAVTAWYLTAKDTIDDEIAALIAKKLEVTTAIQDGAGKDVQMEMLNELNQRLQSRRRR
jgi:SNF2 family DNA or RNA helicase